MFSSENKWVDLHNHNKTVQEVVQIFLDYITRPPRFQDTTNMSRQAAGCDVLADCHCVPSFFFMGWGSAMMQLSNQVIGDIKVTKILQHYAKSDWGRTWKINIFSARYAISQGYLPERKNWKMFHLFFQTNPIYGKTFFKNVPMLLMLPYLKGEIAYHETNTSGHSWKPPIPILPCSN